MPLCNQEAIKLEEDVGKSGDECKDNSEYMASNFASIFQQISRTKAHSQKSGEKKKLLSKSWA